MAIGDILEGQATALYVGASGGQPATEVGGAVSWSAPRRRTTTTRKYYGTTPTKIITGPPEDTWTIGCDLTSNDTGQRFIIAAFAAGTTIAVGYIDGEGNGKWQDVKPSGDEQSGQNPDNANSASYSFGGVSDPVDIGAGPG